MFHELQEIGRRGGSGGKRGRGGGLQTGWRALPLTASPVPGGLAGWWLRPRSPPPGSRRMTLRGAGEGPGLLRLRVVVGAPRLLELALDEIFLQLLPVADHKLFSKILQEQNRTQSSREEGTGSKCCSENTSESPGA